jgi:hypothetical protein
MLYASLVVSGLLVVAAISAARKSQYPALTTFGWAAAACFLPIMMMFVFPVIWLQSAILCVGLLVTSVRGCTREWLRPLAVGSAVVAYAVVGWLSYDEYRNKERDFDRLRADNPFESIEGRLPANVPPSTPGNQETIARLEGEIDWHRGTRSYQLKQLHEQAVATFVNRPGFGATRMMPEWYVSGTELAPLPDAPQPDYFHPAEPVAKEFRRPDAKALGNLHEAGYLDFVNPAGFGYVKDRRHVAGFQSHGFSKVPGPVEKWEVARLELVGLLMHEKPVVYQSQKLPRMDELKDAPTRPLDSFEETALASLRKGEDLHVSEDDPARFLGAVRSTKQCVECHGGERGALLGAFSYRLRPVR